MDRWKPAAVERVDGGPEFVPCDEEVGVEEGALLGARVVEVGVGGAFEQHGIHTGVSQCGHGADGGGLGGE